MLTPETLFDPFVSVACAELQMEPRSKALQLWLYDLKEARRIYLECLTPEQCGRVFESVLSSMIADVPLPPMLQKMLRPILMKAASAVGATRPVVDSRPGSPEVPLVEDPDPTGPVDPVPTGDADVKNP